MSRCADAMEDENRALPVRAVHEPPLPRALPDDAIFRGRSMISPFPLFSEEAVVYVVHSLSSTRFVIAPQDPFARHAQLLHDPPRLPIPQIGDGVDLRETIVGEAPVDHCLRRLRDQPLAPMSTCDPIVDDPDLIRLFDMQADPAYHRCIEDHCEKRLRAPRRENASCDCSLSILDFRRGDATKEPRETWVARIGESVLHVVRAERPKLKALGSYRDSLA